MLLLSNTTQAYAWGSTSAIPSFLGRDSADRPVAEMWMGTHPLGVSRVEDAVGVAVPLTEVAGDLPFMMKILAADKPLSLQVHPSAAIAATGFATEEAAGKPLTAADRSFKDPNHKPEMAYALTTFDTLVGFRPTAEILRVLAAIDVPLAKSLVENLRPNPGFLGIVGLVERLLSDRPAAADVDAVVDACRTLAKSGLDIRRAYLTAVEIAEHFPADVGVVISLFLNRVTLQAGEAAFLEEGVIHAHLSGMCIEVMASSDNVLRAGLTEKFVDSAEVVRCLKKGMSRVARVAPDAWGTSTELFVPDVEEFALAVTQCSPADINGVELPGHGARILICTGGYVEMANEAGEMLRLERGQSVFASAEDGLLRAHGIGEVAQAYTPLPDAPDSRMLDLI